ncbi:MAG: ABC transporter permease [Desulfobacterales bacterium]|nr:ABC transporter permease [Desulfobacterales bacterium]
MISDLFPSPQRWPYEKWLYTAWFRFLVRYRRTLLGPVWLLVGPTLFVVTLGLLFAEIGSQNPGQFVPHLTVGLITWTLISGFVTGSTTVFHRSRAQILQGGMSLTDIVMVDICSTFLLFLHQAVLIVVVFAIVGVDLSLYALLSLAGLALLVVNGIWLTHFFGIIGARYRDLDEIVSAIMRIAFLATPIIWMPGESTRGGIMGAFLVFNPFYHYLELIRGPLLGQPASLLSWTVVLAITVVGFLLANHFHRRFARYIPLWV